MIERQRRVSLVVLICMFLAVGSIYTGMQQQPEPKRDTTTHQVAGSNTVNDSRTSAKLAREVLADLPVKGRAPKTGYTRAQFSDGWQDVGYCDVRNIVLARDMQDVKTVSDTNCTVVSGTLYDPYTAKTIQFTRGITTSDDVQIDHIVALSNAWQTGAQELSEFDRLSFANDLLNLLAVDGPTNQKKSDADAATWLPPNKDYRCRYVARQLAVKQKYRLWVTQPERDAIQNILKSCPNQSLPVITP